MAEWPIGRKTIHSDRYKPIRCDIDDQYIYNRFKVKHIYNKQGQNSVRHDQTVTPELCDPDYTRVVISAYSVIHKLSMYKTID